MQPKGQYRGGRPIRRDAPKKVGWMNVPSDGYVTPRLKSKDYRTNAIGFTADICIKEEEID